MDPSIAIVIADDHPIVRYALRAYLEDHAAVCVLGEASSCAALRQLVRQQRPDVVVADLQYPDGPLLESMPWLITQSRVIAFSAEDFWQSVEAFTAAGGFGFVSKRSQLSELVEAIEAVAANRKWIAPTVRAVSVPANAQRDDTSTAELTRREREVVALVVRGMTSKQIADQLCISLNTVETHRYRIFKKLNIKRIAQLADFAVRHGILPTILMLLDTPPSIHDPH